jgi:hypothetical protein
MPPQEDDVHPFLAGSNKEQNLMRTLPDQPTPLGAVQPIVYVSGEDRLAI